MLIEHTLNYNKSFTDKIRFTGLLGYSYQTFNREGKEYFRPGFCI